MEKDRGPAITGPTSCGTPLCRNALDALMGCTGGVALIAIALSAFLPDRAHAAGAAAPTCFSPPIGAGAVVSRPALPQGRQHAGSPASAHRCA